MKWMLGLLAFGVLAAACGGDATTTEGSASDGGGGTGTASSAGAGGSGGTTTGTSTGTMTGGGGSGGGSGMVCGGFAGDTCPDGEYCDYPDDLCGAADGQGVCKTRPMGCTEQFDPVCGCDGMIHDNPCIAASDGTDLSNLGGCPVASNSFACGPRSCSVFDQYCQHVTSDVGGQPDSYICMQSPCMMAVFNCDCHQAVTMACGGTCSEAMGGVTVHCPGG